MERHWKRIFTRICFNQLKDLRINSWLYHGKDLTPAMSKRIDKRLEELTPYFDSFLKENDEDKLWEMETDKVTAMFDEYLIQCRRTEKLIKIKDGIKSKSARVKGKVP
jgi:hypothetical protein